MVQGVRENRRARLNRDRVVQAAVTLADEGGFDHLSMRKLAEKLEVVPMALYKHVANKDELLDGMVDVVFGEVGFSTGGGWRSAMRDRATKMRQALLRHPWAVGRMETGMPGPANLRHHNATMGCLRQKAGFSFQTAVHAYSLMDSYIYGFAHQEKTLAPDIAGEAETRLQKLEEEHPSPGDEYPHLMEVAAELAKSGYDYIEEFEFGLDLILDGIERLRRQEPASAKSRKLAAKR